MFEISCAAHNSCEQEAWVR